MSGYISKETIKGIVQNGISTDTEADKEYVCALIDSLPPADVRENIHARWESDGHGHIICTACKKAKLNEHKSKFCDSCGAIMDGEPKATAKVVIVGKPSLLTHIPIGEKGTE